MYTLSYCGLEKQYSDMGWNYSSMLYSQRCLTRSVVDVRSCMTNCISQNTKDLFIYPCFNLRWNAYKRGPIYSGYFILHFPANHILFANIVTSMFAGYFLDTQCAKSYIHVYETDNTQLDPYCMGLTPFHRFDALKYGSSSVQWFNQQQCNPCLVDRSKNQDTYFCSIGVPWIVHVCANTISLYGVKLLAGTLLTIGPHIIFRSLHILMVSFYCYMIKFNVANEILRKKVAIKNIWDNGLLLNRR